MRPIKCVQIDRKKERSKDKGFTLIEVMIAIAIFGFLMLYVSQLMRGEIRLLNSATQQSNLEQNARVTMMHILDEIRLHKATYYDAYEVKDDGTGSPNIVRIYYRNPDSSKLEDMKICLLDIEPDMENLKAGTGIYYDSGKHEVWYRDTSQTPPANYRISESIESITITPADQYGHLIKISLKAKSPRSTDSFDLVTWARLY